MNELKSHLVVTIHQIIDERIERIHTELDGTKASLFGETKSSVGDKHETSRAMLQIDIERLEHQINNTMKLKKELHQNTSQYLHSGIVTGGSLVVSTNGLFFIGIGLGIVRVKDKEIYVLSVGSPIGKLLLGKVKGAYFVFKNQQETILEVI